MANHDSAKKSIKQIQKRAGINKNRLSRIKTFIKKALVSIKSNTVEEANTAFVIAQSETFKGVARGVIKPNTAARKISRLANKLRMKNKETDSKI